MLNLTKSVLIQLWYMATTVASTIVMTPLALVHVASVLIPTATPTGDVVDLDGTGEGASQGLGTLG
jgi:hypothetical protein